MSTTRAVEMAVIGVACIKHLLQQLNTEDALVTLVGSLYIAECTDADVDFIIHHKALLSEEMGDIEGWKYGGSDKGGDGWTSYKRTYDGVVVNAIFVDDKAYYSQWATAADVCRTCNLAGFKLPREVVHAIHSVVMDCGDPQEELTRRGVVPC